MRISAEQHQQNETRIRAAIDRLLSGDIPPGGKCDIKTLAREAAVDRAAFYGNRPYACLREEFETRLQARQQAGDIPDRRDAQITRLKDLINFSCRRWDSGMRATRPVGASNRRCLAGKDRRW
jgi:hypothetical protein